MRCRKKGEMKKMFLFSFLAVVVVFLFVFSVLSIGSGRARVCENFSIFPSMCACVRALIHVCLSVYLIVYIL